MLHETYTSCIKPDGIYEGKTIKASDVIELQRGGTGMLMLHHAITQSYTNSGPFYLPSTNKDLGSLRAGAGFCQQDAQSWPQIFDLLCGTLETAELPAGFSLHDGKATQAKKFFQLGPGSGRQDLRGQASAARSLGGLVFQN